MPSTTRQRLLWPGIGASPTTAQCSRTNPPPTAYLQIIHNKDNHNSNNITLTVITSNINTPTVPLTTLTPTPSTNPSTPK